MLSSLSKSGIKLSYSMITLTCVLVLVLLLNTVSTAIGQISSGNIVSGSETIGTFTIDATEVGPGGYLTAVNATVDVEPEAGNVFEGWLVDPDGSLYALSLGNFLDGVLHFNQYMTNPFVYDQFIVTQEPLRDTNPDINPPSVGSFSLRDPFNK